MTANTASGTEPTTTGGPTTAMGEVTTTGGEVTGGQTTDTESTGSTGEESGGPGCGDGVVDFGETCDDGNDVAGDGCSADCVFEPGVALPPIDHPQDRDVNGVNLCLTAIDAALLEGRAHALVLGGAIDGFGPEGQRGGYVLQAPLPGVDPVTWSFADHAGIHERLAYKVETANNGDVVVAGEISTEKLKVDSGGFLWLARFTAAGELVWSHEFEDIFVRPTDLVLTPGDEIVVSGIFSGFGSHSSAQAFDGAGTLLWSEEAPSGDDWAVYYEGAAVGADGTIFLVGFRLSFVEDEPVMGHLSARSPEGAELWALPFGSPTHPYVRPTDVDLTTDGALVVALSERMEPFDPWMDSQPALAAFTTAGELTWWKGQPAPAPWTGQAGPLIAAPDGGVFIATAERKEGSMVRRRVARVDAEGQQIWATVSEGPAASDAVLAPDGLLYVLAEDVFPYVP